MKFMVYLILSLFVQQRTYFSISRLGKNGLMQIIPKYSGGKNMNKTLINNTLNNKCVFLKTFIFN